MVLCLIALPIFAVLSIFSLKYRKLTLDAWRCLVRTATLRKCDSGLDDRIKSSITGIFLKVSPRLAKFFYTHYKAISWVILAIFLWATWYSGLGIYNYIKYGNCNGAESVAFCALKSGLSWFDRLCKLFV